MKLSILVNSRSSLLVKGENNSTGGADFAGRGDRPIERCAQGSETHNVLSGGPDVFEKRVLSTASCAIVSLD